MGGQEIFMDSKSEFAQSVHGFVGIFAQKTAAIFRKGNVQHPVHGFNLPMLPGKRHKLFCRNISAGNIITGFYAVLSAHLNTALNGKNSLQTWPFVFLQPGNILHFAADSFFYPPCIFLYGLETFPFTFVVGVFKKQTNICQQGRLVFLQAKQIIPLILYDPAAGFSLAMQCICGDSFSFNVQIGNHFLKNRDLICLFVNQFLTKDNSAAGNISAENLQCTVGISRLPCTANRLPIHRNYFSACPKPLSHHIDYGLTNFSAVYHTQYPAKGCLGRNALNTQLFPQKFLLVFGVDH